MRFLKTSCFNTPFFINNCLCFDMQGAVIYLLQKEKIEPFSVRRY
ncbi:hypothetical protein PSPO_b1501 [Pseudoalteromonas spongiae UST010723-006]|nr:hypothetical protein PSPO_b1501 [Pseudoalteromonas spongiae UST010723-006]